MLTRLVCKLQLYRGICCTRNERLLCQRIKWDWQPRPTHSITTICFISGFFPTIRRAHSRDDNDIRRPNARLERSTSSLDGAVNVVAPAHEQLHR